MSLFNYCFISLSPSLPPIFCHSFIFSFNSSFVCYSISCLSFLALLLCQIFIYFLLQCPLFHPLNVDFFFLLFLFCFAVAYSYILRSSFRSLFSFFVYFFRSFLFFLLFEFVSFLCIFHTLFLIIFFLTPFSPVVVYSSLLCCFCSICLSSTFTPIPCSLFLS